MKNVHLKKLFRFWNLFIYLNDSDFKDVYSYIWFRFLKIVQITKMFIFRIHGTFSNCWNSEAKRRRKKGTEAEASKLTWAGPHGAVLQALARKSYRGSHLILFFIEGAPTSHLVNVRYLINQSICSLISHPGGEGMVMELQFS